MRTSDQPVILWRSAPGIMLERPGYAPIGSFQRAAAVHAFLGVLRVSPLAAGALLLLDLSEQERPSATRASSSRIVAHSVAYGAFFHGASSDISTSPASPLPRNIIRTGIWDPATLLIVRSKGLITLWSGAPFQESDKPLALAATPIAQVHR